MSNKLKSEISEKDACLFLDNIKFVMVKIDKAEELYTIESKARIKLLKTLDTEALNTVLMRTPKPEETKKERTVS